MPVSYTHLDVYKRQVSAGITSFNFNLGIQLSVFDKVDIGVNADLRGLALGSKKTGYYSSTAGYNKVDSLNLHPVSYTHLDVYKRQGLYYW